MNCGIVKQKALKWEYWSLKNSVYSSLKKRGAFEYEGQEELVQAKFS